MKIKKLDQYCKDNLLTYDIHSGILSINNKKWIIINDDTKLFNDDFEFSLKSNDIDESGWVYEFGGRWYLQRKKEEISLDELKYIGKVNKKLNTDSFLGIRSGYELMNGIGLYKDWIKKAVFLGVKSLAICEKSTLSGVLVFQNECKKNNIKSIIGMTIPVIDINENIFDIKLYVKDFQGWLNLLKFNSILNVDQKSNIELSFLNNNKNGLFIIADPKSMNIEHIFSSIDYFQLDTVIFQNEDKDKEYIDNLEKFLKSNIKPISITDAFYLEKKDYEAREVLWSIAKSYDYKTINQYFKSKDQYAKELIKMFQNEDKSWIKILKSSIFNEKHVVENCNFLYDTDTRHLPKYMMTKDESKNFKTNEDLFLHLIKIGFKKRKIKDIDKYIERLQVEIKVLKEGDVIDYFLSMYDIIKFAKSKDMLLGIARGSAGGSLVAYLLDIIQVDPLKFDLLFERFLNSGRMGVYKDRPSYEIKIDEKNVINLKEGSILKVNRNNEKIVIFIHDLKVGDNIIKY